MLKVITINGGNICTVNSGNTNINGGRFISKSSSSALHAMENGAFIRIRGGSFETGYGITIADNDSTPNIEITGGTFKTKTSLICVNQTQGVYGVSVSPLIIFKNMDYNIAIEYKRIANILALKGKTIYENCNITYADNYLIQGGGEIVINNCTITGKSVGYRTKKVIINNSNINTTETSFDEGNGNKIEITDTIIESGGYGFKNSSYAESSSILVKGNTRIKSKDAIITGFSNITIESGVLESEEASAIEYAYGNINIGVKDGEVKEEPSLKSPTTSWTIYAQGQNVNFYDGKLIGNKNEIIGATIGDLEDGKDIISNINENGEEELTLGNNTNVIENIDTGVVYNTIKEAFNECNNNGNISRLRLLKNVNMTDHIIIDKDQNIDFDLNGKQLRIYSEEVFKNTGTLNIKNSIEDEEYNVYTTNKNNIFVNDVIKEEGVETKRGKLTLNNIKIYDYKFFNGKIDNFNDRTLKNDFINRHIILNYGELELSDTSLKLENSAGFSNVDNGSIVMKSGDIDVTLGVAFVNKDNANINIESGMITEKAELTVGIYNDSTGQIEIKKVENKEPLKLMLMGSAPSNTSTVNRGIYDINEESKIHIEDIYIESSGTMSNAKRGVVCKGSSEIDNATVKGYYNYGMVLENSIIKEATIDIYGSDGNISRPTAGTGIFIKAGKIKHANIKGANSFANPNGLICNGAVEIDDININVQNVAITVQNGVQEGANVTIKNADIYGASRGIEIKIAGSCYLESGNINSDNIGIYVEDEAKCNIGVKLTDEEIENEGIPSITNPSIIGKDIGVDVVGNAIVNFYDGIIVGNVDKSIVGVINEKEQLYQIFKTKDIDNSTETSILKKTKLFEIVGVQDCYSIEQLQEEINKMETNREYIVKVVNDVDFSESDITLVIPENIQIQFDLNGMTIEAMNENTIQNNGTMTILDSCEGNTSEKSNHIRNIKNGTFIKNTGIMKIQSLNMIIDGAGGEDKGIVNEGTLTIEDAIIKSKTTAYTGKLINNINSGSITIKSSDITLGSIYSSSDNKLEIVSGTIKATQIINEGTGTLTINEGSTINNLGVANSMVRNTGTGTLMINGGNFIQHAIVNNGTGTTFINGGSFVTPSNDLRNCNVRAVKGLVKVNGVEIYSISVNEDAETIIDNENSEVNYIITSGNVNIKNGTIHSIQATTKYNAKNPPIVNIEGGKIEATSGSAIVLENESNSKVKAILNIGIKDNEVNINSPQIIGQQGYTVIKNPDDSEINFYDGKVKATETIYWINSYISNIEDGYNIKMEEPEEGNYEVYLSEKENILSVNSTEYSSLKEAIEACTNEENTITVLKDFATVEENVEISSDKNITLDLNGKKIYAYTKNTQFVNNGIFKIVDSSETKTGVINNFATVFIENNNTLEVEIVKLQSHWFLEDSKTQQDFIYNKGTVNWHNGKIYLYSESKDNYRRAFKNEGTSTLNWDDGYIYSNNGSHIIYQDGTGTINWKNGEIYSNYTLRTFTMTDGTLNINNIKYGHIAPNAQQLFISSDGNITIDNFEATEYQLSGRTVNYGITGSPKRLTINGGTFEGFTSDIEINNNSSNGQTYINGGTFNDWCKFSGSYGYAYINGGTFAKVYVGNKSTSMTGGKISGKKISSYDTTQYGLGIYANATFSFKNGAIETTNSTYSAVLVDSGTFVMGTNDNNVNIEEPTISSKGIGVKNNKGKFYFYDGIIQGDNVAISGTVTAIPANYKINYSDGNKIAQLGLDLVVENIVSVNGVYYGSLDEAVKAASAISKISGNNVTITVCQDIDLQSPITINNDSDITIDLNSNTIEYYESTDPSITNNGKLTIVDNSADGTQMVDVAGIIQSTTGYAIENNGTLTIGNASITQNINTPSIKGKTNAINNNGTLILNSGMVDNAYVTRGTQVAQTSILEVYKLAQNKTLYATNRIFKQVVSSVVVPIIKVSSELPVWTNESVTATMYARKMIQLEIFEQEFEEITGKYNLVVTKVNKDNPEQKVTGAEFEIYENETKVGTLTDADNDGIYESGDIAISEAGTKNITIKETVVPAGYAKIEDKTGTITFEKASDKEEYIVKESTLGIVQDSGIIFTIEEPKLVGKYNLVVTKVNKDNLEQKVTGAEFEIYENETKVGTLTDADNDGIYESGDIGISEAGTKNITIKETVVPAGYAKIEDKTGTIIFEKASEKEEYIVKESTLGTVEDSGIIFTIEEPKLVGKYNLVVTKVNKDNPEEKVTGAEFEIYENETKVGTLTDADNDGIYESGDIGISEAGTKNITIKETVVPEGYERIEDKTGTITFEKASDKEEYIVKESSLGMVQDSGIIFTIEEPKTIEKYNLAVRKFVSAIDDEDIETRIPVVEIDEEGKITYKQSSEIEEVSNSQKITYTLRMYNESNNDAKGKKVIEYIPDGLVFLPSDETNTKYHWMMLKIDENGKPRITDNPEEAVMVVSDYLVDKEIKAYDRQVDKDLNYLDVQAVFEVNESKLTPKNRIIENKVKIMPSKNDEDLENDESTEKVYVKYFDLDITKYIEEVKVKNNREEKIQSIGIDKKGQLVNIDVREKDVNDTTITVTYGLIVKNIGEIPGYATEIVDYIPKDFKLVEDETWSIDEDKAITKSLEKVLLEPGESTKIQITFEWNLEKGDIGSRINEAKILSYKNEYNAKDLTENNNDKEEILVTIRTGSEKIMVIKIGLILIITIGMVLFFIGKKMADEK